tara:strand:- start:50 stop:220 length:171 start_codon:yes stop_codon:yes gene_type:complete
MASIESELPGYCTWEELCYEELVAYALVEDKIKTNLEILGAPMPNNFIKYSRKKNE